jgi:hypothetical protein
MQTQQLKFNLIDNLISLKDKKLLYNIEKLLSSIKVDDAETFHLTPAQLKMLKESNADLAKQRKNSCR